MTRALSASVLAGALAAGGACGGKATSPATTSPAAAPAEPRRTVVTDGKVEVLDPITFVEGAADVTPGSTPILDAVAATLASDPSLRLVEVQVSAADGQLAQDRAERILEELVGRGVAPERLRANAVAAEVEAGQDVAFEIIARTP